MMMQKIMRSATKGSYPTWQITKTNFHLIKAVFIFHIFWFILGILGFEYLPLIVSLDIGLLILSILHLSLFIPLAKKSVVPAYFKENYGTSFLTKVYVIRDVLVVGALIRLGGYYILTSLIQYATPATPREIEMIWVDKLSNPKGLLLALTLYLAYIFFLYYQERFMKIGDYYSEVVEDMYQRKVNSQVAMQHVWNRRRRDRDKEKHSNSIQHTARKNTPAASEKVSFSSYQPTGQVKPVEAVRKKARNPSTQKVTTPNEPKLESNGKANNKPNKATNRLQNRTFKAKKKVIQKIEKNRKRAKDVNLNDLKTSQIKATLPKRRKARK